MPFADACRMTADFGFSGIEIAPFTLTDDPRTLDHRRIEQLRKTMEDSGLACIGLHWLLTVPKGLHLTTPDEEVRARSWEFMRFLIDLCADLGGSVMVLGSTKQRNTVGIPVEQAVGYLTRGLEELGEPAENRNVSILLESLPNKLTDVINTMDEAAEVIDRIGSPGIRGMFDFHNCDDESESWSELLQRHFGMIEHVHLNSVDGGYPTEAGPELSAAFELLAKRHFSGWISLEIFHFDEAPEKVLASTRRVIDEIEEHLVSSPA
jgi:sugar phosphate isomerase/epimerase